uniref:Uncharacterized protein n=1 Tax=Grammatophora oceanica TaxID=210454 RepID=A0A7S1Y8A6_9STRA
MFCLEQSVGRRAWCGVVDHEAPSFCEVVPPSFHSFTKNITLCSQHEYQELSLVSSQSHPVVWSAKHVSATYNHEIVRTCQILGGCRPTLSFFPLANSRK